MFAITILQYRKKVKRKNHSQTCRKCELGEQAEAKVTDRKGPFTRVQGDRQNKREKGLSKAKVSMLSVSF